MERSPAFEIGCKKTLVATPRSDEGGHGEEGDHTTGSRRISDIPDSGADATKPANEHGIARHDILQASLFLYLVSPFFNDRQRTDAAKTFSDTSTTSCYVQSSIFLLPPRNKHLPAQRS